MANLLFKTTEMRVTYCVRTYQMFINLKFYTKNFRLFNEFCNIIMLIPESVNRACKYEEFVRHSSNLKPASDIEVGSVRESHAHAVLSHTFVLALIRLETLLYLQRT